MAYSSFVMSNFEIMYPENLTENETTETTILQPIDENHVDKVEGLEAVPFIVIGAAVLYTSARLRYHSRWALLLKSLFGYNTSNERSYPFCS